MNGYQIRKIDAEQLVQHFVNYMKDINIDEDPIRQIQTGLMAEIDLSMAE
jgi:hypothetical protein